MPLNFFQAALGILVNQKMVKNKLELFQINAQDFILLSGTLFSTQTLVDFSFQKSSFFAAPSNCNIKRLGCRKSWPKNGNTIGF